MRGLGASAVCGPTPYRGQRRTSELIESLKRDLTWRHGLQMASVQRTIMDWFLWWPAVARGWTNSSPLLEVDHSVTAMIMRASSHGHARRTTRAFFWDGITERWFGACTSLLRQRRFALYTASHVVRADVKAGVLLLISGLFLLLFLSH